jgi:hypothetical protein
VITDLGINDQIVKIDEMLDSLRGCRPQKLSA